MAKFYKNKDNSFQLYKEDVLKFLRKLEDNSVDMIFSDPPYFLSSGSFSVQNGKRVDVKKGDWDLSNGLDADFSFHEKWIKECFRVLKEKGTIWISGTYHSIYMCGFILQKEGFLILNDISWFKPNAGPNLSGRRFAASHETLLWAIKNKKHKHTFNYKDMKHGEWHIKDKLKNEDKQMRSVWSISTTPKSEKLFGKHPTQKPLTLLNRIVLSSTNENDLIVDPFAGSGTTGISAYMNNRRFIGCDIEEEYLTLAKKRFLKIK